jgi:Bacterial Ig-like domain
MRNAVVVSALCLAVGCGAPSRSSAPDAAPDAASDAGPAAAVKVTSITPADGATKVSAYTKVTVQLSGAADAASISDRTVKLFVGESRLPVAGAVAYDAAAHTITFTPAASLHSLSGFRVDVNGVTAASAAVAEAVARFRTFVGPMTSDQSFDQATNPTSRITYEHDADGRITANVWWETDDQIGNWDAYVYTDNHVRVIHYADAGLDGKWRTADDTVESYSDQLRGVAGQTRNVEYFDPGADKAWFTADDEAGLYQDSTYDDLDRLARVRFAKPGPDHKLDTADDETTSYSDYHYDGNPSEVFFGDRGPDKVWMTADDVPSLGTFGGADGSSTTQKPGPDGKLGTADDVITFRHTSERDDHGNTIKTVQYGLPGGDGKWGTADDVAQVWETATFDGNGTKVEAAAYNAGLDGQAFTDDDWKTDGYAYDPSL